MKPGVANGTREMNCFEQISVTCYSLCFAVDSCS